jgi:hypothetical protein
MDPIQREENDDDKLNDSLSEAEPGEADDDELRLARISEHRQESLRKVDSLRASLGALNAGLLDIALCSETALKKTLRATSGDILEISHLQRAISIHLNITRQIDRFANLDARLEDTTQQAENSKAQRRRGLCGLPPGAKHGR